MTGNDSTKALQEKIADKEMLLNEILEGTLAGFWDWRIQDNTEYMSPTFKSMFGYEDHEIENTPESWQKLIFQEDLPGVFEIFNKHIESKGKFPYDCRVRYHHKNGSTVHVWCRGKVVEWEGDTPIRMVGSHINVTELVEATKRIEISNMRQDLIIKGINAGIWDWDIQTNEEWWSPRFYQLLGFEQNEIVSSYESFLRLLHPEDKPLVLEAVREHLEDKKPYKLEIRMLNKKEQYIWLETSGQAMWDKEGKAIHMTGSLIDIHQRKLAEKQMEENEELLKEAGRLAKIGGWEVDLASMQPRWSEQVYNIHEVPIGKQPPLDKALDFYPEPSRTEISNLLQRAIEKGIGFDQEFDFITAKGNKRFVRSIGSPIINEDNKVIGLKGVFQDTTDRRYEQLALRESMDILGEQNTRLTNFAHIVSHNLNSHTSNIKMLLDFLNRTQGTKEFTEYFEMISAATANLDESILHLNEIVKIQTDINKKRKLVSIPKVYNSITQILRGKINETGATIKTDFKVKNIEYVPAYLESILLNFTTNALKYMRPNVPPKIEIGTHEKNGKIWLVVKDNGLGIDLDRHGKKLFGMYKTFHKNPDSRGIGLFITKNQVEALGGIIKVESEVGKGTSFKVRLN